MYSRQMRCESINIRLHDGQSHSLLLARYSVEAAKQMLMIPDTSEEVSGSAAAQSKASST